jgi:DNA-binding CsgD family transcriptional regulator
VGVQKRDLTEGQIECLRLVAGHYTSKEIARKLGISHFTVDQRLDAARRKLGVASRKEAAMLFQSMDDEKLSDRLVYQADAIAEQEQAPNLKLPTSSRGYSYAGGSFSERAFGSVEKRDSKASLQQLLSIIRVPPIGGGRHELSKSEVLLQAVNIAFYSAIMLGVVTIILTGVMRVLS